MVVLGEPWALVLELLDPGPYIAPASGFEGVAQGGGWEQGDRVQMQRGGGVLGHNAQERMNTAVRRALVVQVLAMHTQWAAGCSRAQQSEAGGSGAQNEAGGNRRWEGSWDPAAQRGWHPTFAAQVLPGITLEQVWAQLSPRADTRVVAAEGARQGSGWGVEEANDCVGDGGMGDGVQGVAWATGAARAPRLLEKDQACRVSVQQAKLICTQQLASLLPIATCCTQMPPPPLPSLPPYCPFRLQSQML